MGEVFEVLAAPAPGARTRGGRTMDDEDAMDRAADAPPPEAPPADWVLDDAPLDAVPVVKARSPDPRPASMVRPSEEDRKRWAEADAEDERNGWGDARRRVQTAFAER